MGSSVSYPVYEDTFEPNKSADFADVEEEGDVESSDFKDSNDEFYDAEDDSLQAETLVKNLTCANLNLEKSDPYIVRDYKFLNREKKIELLNEGCTLFSFSCHVGDQLNQREKDVCDSIINMSCAFDDEEKENCVPVLDITDDDDLARYTIIATKVSYLVPDVDLTTITPELICEDDYISKCVPGSPYIWPDINDPKMFRITKSIVPYIYSITIQLKVTEVTEAEDLKRINSLDDVKVDKAFILERTKRNKQNQDATAKAKSMLSYIEVDGGVLVTNLTVVLNTTVPSFLTPFIDRLGSFGCGEASQTCMLSRKYLLEKAKRDRK